MISAQPGALRPTAASETQDTHEPGDRGPVRVMSTAGDPPRPVHPRWYGQMPLVVDALSIGTLAVMERTSPEAHATLARQGLWAASAGAYLFFAPYHHNTHYGPPPGLPTTSLMLRFGVPALGGLTGLLLGSHHHQASSPDAPTPLPRDWIDGGVLVGLVGAALFDDLVMARRADPAWLVEATTARRRVSPTIGTARQGATVGLTGLW